MSSEYVLAALIGLSMALIKLLEKAWDARGGRADAPSLLAAIQAELSQIRAIAAQQTHVSARQTEISERMDRRLEKLERGQIRLLERSASTTGGVE